MGIANSLDAAVDMIIHCIFADADGTDGFKDDVAEGIVEQGAYVNPTLHVYRVRIWALERKRKSAGLTTDEQRLLDTEYRRFETRLEHCRRLIEMGVKVVTGSDSSWGNYRLGNTPYETECLVMAGCSSMQGVLSVTGVAAAALGIDDDVGTLEPGKEADFIVLDGNPAEDVGDLWNVTEVFQAGRRVDRGSAESRAATRQLPPS